MSNPPENQAGGNETKSETKVSAENAPTTAGVGQSSAYPTKEEFKGLVEKQKSDQNILLVIMAGVVIFIVVTFWLELYAVNRNYAQDKSLMLQNNQLNKDYFDKVLFLNNEIQDLKTKIEVLRARNSYLK
ncbi:hypothetical protein A3C91_00375 [Candidatus Azambacteria bacterium RIFCSPHIGHO2_02_FULL_52_12]|uniref:Uncharacterized protein n=1 Tax=Candidatus Azambacteria bacterium RIFCSPLOWO2_01_FULL_46_25 TaxID=1797298 RepID=A0A1F5BTN9_9BACT|nr:MAG: hypothetical protein A3C91_00375 [Candidatus Azambacteria bacterium RIFCSPHIGHO2_02_FULL_52_12]OGD33987.1 MAG: hypothetical protein A2988_00680 [Candidatus Azambacteria bacterium RIFCSPLOWO2_01_FULL_46_25]